MVRRPTSVAARAARIEFRSGFTLIELVTVMILVGILAVFAVPRMLDSTFDERGFHDAAKAALQHARRVAIASRRYVCVTNTTGTGPSANLALTMDTTEPEVVTSIGCAGGAGTTVPLPAPGRGCAANQVCAPKSITLGGSSVIFDPLGQSVTAPRTPAAATITVTSQPNITVAAATGYVQ